MVFIRLSDGFHMPGAIQAVTAWVQRGVVAGQRGEKGRGWTVRGDNEVRSGEGRVRNGGGRVREAGE
jgi:hypothetical protein